MLLVFYNKIIYSLSCLIKFNQQFEYQTLIKKNILLFIQCLKYFIKTKILYLYNQKKKKKVLAIKN